MWKHIIIWLIILFPAGANQGRFGIPSSCLARASEMDKQTLITQVFMQDTTTQFGDKKAEMSVYLNNPAGGDSINGFRLYFRLDSPDILSFADSSGDSVCRQETLYTQTCDKTLPPPYDCALSGDSGQLVSIPNISTICPLLIDTAGSLVSRFDYLNTSIDFETKNYLNVTGIARVDTSGVPIPPGTQGLLFKVVFNLAFGNCTLTGKDTAAYVTIPIPSDLSDPQGNRVDSMEFYGGLTYVQAMCTKGELNGDGRVSPGDVVFLINFLFRQGPETLCPSDADLNSVPGVSPGDVVWLINYVFKQKCYPINCLCS